MTPLIQWHCRLKSSKALAFSLSHPPLTPFTFMTIPSFYGLTYYLLLHASRDSGGDPVGYSSKTSISS